MRNIISFFQLDNSLQLVHHVFFLNDPRFYRHFMALCGTRLDNRYFDLPGGTDSTLPLGVLTDKSNCTPVAEAILPLGLLPSIPVEPSCSGKLLRELRLYEYIDPSEVTLPRGVRFDMSATRLPLGVRFPSGTKLFLGLRLVSGTRLPRGVRFAPSGRKFRLLLPVSGTRLLRGLRLGLKSGTRLFRDSSTPARRPPYWVWIAYCRARDRGTGCCANRD
ncbi:hypothetical protein U1Q18_049454 [Sarracenia purpurea var. burkii]